MANLSVIDLDKTTAMNDGDPDEAQYILELFVEKSLPETRELFAEAYAEQDIPELRAAAHRLEGTLCYISLPKMQQALEVLHESLKQVPVDFDKIKAEYANLISEFDAFSQHYNEFHKK